ncbi:hypothetical protein [Alteromonas ponticola]|uniref:Uncharacterized protein n=1 Tax=Alteromonas ponticola TaxID=2720613 RepID=A0ABX1R268_9ALTE|nr:hypothetical protein [Alteromonas ponticola]NMH60189.1 hypothetical protein [Alteromonas ponticola]
MQNDNSLYNLAFPQEDASELANLSQDNLKKVYPELYLKAASTIRRKRRARSKANEQSKMSDTALVALTHSTKSFVEESYFRSRWYRYLKSILVKFARKAFFHKPSFEQDIHLILTSDFFDAQWYSDSSGVQGSDKALARHYLLHGYANLLDPSSSFSTKAYLQFNPDIISSALNPLVHYLRHGVLEKRKIAESSYKKTENNE